MRNVAIHTSLSTSPKQSCGCDHSYIGIVKGASASLTFDLFDKIYTFDDIEQVTFIFKQGSIINYYEMVEYQPDNPEVPWKLDSHFSYDHGMSYSYINFLFSPEETNELLVDEPIEFEIAIKLDTDAIIAQGLDSVIIEKQHPLMVIDSLYSKVLRDKAGQDSSIVVCSTSTICSARLTCNN